MPQTTVMSSLVKTNLHMHSMFDHLAAKLNLYLDLTCCLCMTEIQTSLPYCFCTCLSVWSKCVLGRAGWNTCVSHPQHGSAVAKQRVATRLCVSSEIPLFNWQWKLFVWRRQSCAIFYSEFEGKFLCTWISMNH